MLNKRNKKKIMSPFFACILHVHHVGRWYISVNKWYLHETGSSGSFRHIEIKCMLQSERERERKRLQQRHFLFVNILHVDVWRTWVGDMLKAQMSGNLWWSNNKRHWNYYQLSCEQCLAHFYESKKKSKGWEKWTLNY